MYKILGPVILNGVKITKIFKHKTNLLRKLRSFFIIAKVDLFEAFMV